MCQGNLIVEAELLFPSSLSEIQKMLLKAAFFLPAKLTATQIQAIKTFETAFKHPSNGWETGFPKD